MRPTYWGILKGSDVRAEKLIHMITSARLASAGSENKQIRMTLDLTAEEARKLDRLKGIMGKRGRVATLKSLIELVYLSKTKE